jgi:23S rRNA pseudouridine1911/1915/1917 synthase
MTTFRHALVIPPEQQGRRLDQALAELLPDYSRSRIKQWILAGCVHLDGITTEPRARVAAGQRVELTAMLDDDSAARAQPVTFDIVHEDAEVIVVNKPAGLVVHPGAGNREGTLVNGLLHHDPTLAVLPRSGLLHRLDKDTSGLILVAKTVRAYTHLARDLQQRRITREYRAIVNGVLTAGGSVDAPIGRHTVYRTRMTVSRRGRPAVTHYRVLGRCAAHTFIAVRLETGRTHQIRVHMAHAGFPLLGDPTYGGRARLPAGASAALAAALQAYRRQALHASGICFSHPVSEQPMEFHAPLPGDMHALLAALAGSEAAARQLERLRWPPASN